MGYVERCFERQSIPWSRKNVQAVQSTLGWVLGLLQALWQLNTFFFFKCKLYCHSWVIISASLVQHSPMWWPQSKWHRTCTGMHSHRSGVYSIELLNHFPCFFSILISLNMRARQVFLLIVSKNLLYSSFYYADSTLIFSTLKLLDCLSSLCQ